MSRGLPLGQLGHRPPLASCRPHDALVPGGPHPLYRWGPAGGRCRPVPHRAPQHTPPPAAGHRLRARSHPHHAPRLAARQGSSWALPPHRSSGPRPCVCCVGGGVGLAPENLHPVEASGRQGPAWETPGLWGGPDHTGRQGRLRDQDVKDALSVPTGSRASGPVRPGHRLGRRETQAQSGSAGRASRLRGGCPALPVQ